jgi:hypothetical protein
MSYCRFNDGTNPFDLPPDLDQGRSDAYIFESVEGHWECCGCWLADDEWRYCASTKELMLVHIAEHRAAGHIIPESVDEELRQEIAEEAS